MPLARAIEIVPASDWAGKPFADRMTLTYHDRHRRRMRYVAEGGTAFLLDLPRAAVLRAGDGLRLEDGRVIRIEAAPEALLEVTAPDALTLIRIAWHIGNRHLPVQLESSRILIWEDAVIAEMLRGLGASVAPVCAPFTPESGAYDAHASEHNHPVHTPDGVHHHGHHHHRPGES
jgi:urease accessory protein